MDDGIASQLKKLVDDELAKGAVASVDSRDAPIVFE
jgi:hypothetical protein